MTTHHKSDDYKIIAVNYYLDNNTSYVNVCNIFKCSERSLKRWKEEILKEREEILKSHRKTLKKKGKRWRKKEKEMEKKKEENKKKYNQNVKKLAEENVFPKKIDI